MKQAVILLAAGAEPVAEVLCELSAQGMLRDCLVLDAQGHGSVIEQGVRLPIDLHEYLARRALTLVRVIHLSLDGAPIAQTHLDTVAKLDATVTPVGVELERTSLVVPLDGVELDRDAFPQYRNYNLLVQPVDQAGESGFAILALTDPSKQVVIATAMVALCGALWQWLDEGPLDGGRFRTAIGEAAMPYDGSLLDGRVRLVRAVTRMVDAGDIAGQAVSWALAPGVQFPPPSGCVRHGEPRQAVNALLDQMFPTASTSPFGFNYVPYVLPASPSVKHVTPLQAIAMFMGEFWRELRKMPGEAADRVVARVKTSVENAVASNTYGEDSEIVVKFGKPTSAELATDAGSRVEAVLALPNLVANSPSSTPQTWTTLVGSVLAAADGNDPPTGVKIELPKWNNQRAAVTDFGALVHPSIADESRGQFILMKDEAGRLGWSAETDVAFNSCDAYGARSVLSVIDGMAQPGADAAAKSDMPPPPPPPPPPAPEPPSKKPAPKDAPAQAAVAVTDAEASSVLAIQQLPHDLQVLRKRLLKWTAEREQTLMWRVADALMRQQDKAFGELTQASSELKRTLDEMAKAEETEIKNRKWFRKKAFWITLWFLFVTAGAVVGFVLLPALSVFIWIGVFVFGLLTTCKSILKTAKERVRQKHRRELVYLRPAQLMEQRQKAADEFVRLSSVYQQLQDWAEILACALHRPLGHVSQVSEQPWATSVGALSFVSGIPKIDSDRMRRTTLSVMQHLATRGWLSRAYSRQRTMILDKYGELAGGVSATDQSPEADNSLECDVLARLPGLTGEADIVIYPPRENLRSQFAEGTSARSYRTEQVEALHKTVVTEDPYGMIESVSSDIIGLNEPPRNPAAFLAPVVEWNSVPHFNSALRPRLQLDGVPVRSIVGISAGIDATFMEARSATIAVNPVPHRFTLAAFRIDISDSIPVSEVLHITQTSNRTAVVPPADDEPDDTEQIVRG